MSSRNLCQQQKRKTKPRIRRLAIQDERVLPISGVEKGKGEGLYYGAVVLFTKSAISSPQSTYRDEGSLLKGRVLMYLSVLLYPLDHISIFFVAVSRAPAPEKRTKTPLVSKYQFQWPIKDFLWPFNGPLKAFRGI